MVLLSCEHPLFFKKQGNDTEGDSAIIRTTTLVSRGQMVSAQSLGGVGPLHGATEEEPPGTLGAGTGPAEGKTSSQNLRGEAISQWTWKAEFEPNRIILKSYDLMEFALLGFDLAGNSLPLSCLLISPFWNWNIDTMPLSPWLFSKHMACLVSQVHSWKGILLQDELYLKSHSHLIQIFT